MSRIKYVVLPGYITSKYDGDRHYINADRLMKLYKVKPEECCIYINGKDATDKYKNLIWLRPRYHGNYDLKEQGE